MSPARTEDARTRLWRARLVGITAAGALALALGLYLAPQLREERPELPVVGTMPSFELVDQRGDPITPDAFRGRPLIANFIFTRCPTVCPVFTMKLARIQDDTSELGEDLQLASFSVDPEYDTPERLTAYAEKYDADPDRWTFLTGELEEMRRAIHDGLYIAMEPEGELPGGGPNIIHTTHFVLFDAELNVRGYYDSNDPERLDELVRDARQLAEGG